MGGLEPNSCVIFLRDFKTAAFEEHRFNGIDLDHLSPIKGDLSTYMNSY